MALETILMIIGWVLVGIPTTIFLIVSGHMMYGASTDDESVKALVILGLTIFGVGAGLLLLVYLTDIFPRLFN